MSYGIIKVDTITFTDGGVDKSIQISGLVQNPTFSGNVTCTGTISGVTITGSVAQFTTITGGSAGFTTVTGTTVTGATANFVSGVFTSQISGTTVTGTTASFTSGNFTNISGGTHTITSGVFASGTAANPSISFVSDPNSGLYSPGADQVAISTNGTGRLFVASDGKIGIANATPQTALGLANNANISFGTSNYPYIAGNDASNFLAFGTQATERMRLDSSGRLGLGTSGPVTPIEVVGASTTDTEENYALFRGPGTAQPGVYIGGNATTASTGATARYGYVRSQSLGGTARALYLQTGTDTRVVIDNTGKVGIGTTSPGVALHVDGDIRCDGVYGETDTNTSIQFPGSDVITFNEGGSEAARIDSSGRLLVGTSSALSAMGITASFQNLGTSVGNSSLLLGAFNGDNGVRPELTLAKSGSGTIGGFAAVEENETLGRVRFAGADGTSFIEAAQIEARVDGTPGTNDMPGRLVLSTTADGASSPTERMRITSAGFVGIGTAAPAALAHLAGNTIISNVDVANATYDSISFSVATEEATPTGLFFSNDGRKMFVTGATGDDINEYTLSTPWNVSTATYVTVFSVSGQDSSPQDLYFRNDGKKLYVVGSTNDSVFQYTLTTPWSIASASYDTVSFSISAEELAPTGLFFKPDGLAFYIVGTTNDTVYRYNLGTAWDISTATLANSFSVTGQETSPNAISFTADGSRMFVMGITGDDVNIYNLTTPWGITTAAFVTTFSVASQDTLPQGLFIRADGAKFYMLGSTNDAVFQYSIPSATIDLTGTTNINGSAEVAQDLTVYGGISSGSIQVADAGNITVGTTTGTKIGTATTQKLGFYNATPVVQPTAVADATDAATVITQLNDLLAKLRTLGIIAT
jgi:sugar lactone lactonase YvrE